MVTGKAVTNRGSLSDRSGPHIQEACGVHTFKEKDRKSSSSEEKLGGRKQEDPRVLR